MPTDPVLPSGSQVLLLEDDGILCKRLAAYLRGQGVEVAEAGTLAQARRLLQEFRFDFALVDLHLPDGEVLGLLREGLFSENTAVVVMTAFGGIRQAVEAMRLGAGDYLTKPFEPDQLPLAFLRSRRDHASARREEHHRQAPAGGGDPFFFGESLAPLRGKLESILAAERRLEHRLPPILLEGETGTGKSLLARWIHQQGPRAAAPFVAVNCAALPETLAEAELFGHERGAFTDAKRGRIGLFEAADGGTLFLDELGAFAPGTQAKLLTAIEEGHIRRLGSVHEQPVDARIIAASNQPLAELVKAGKFREDLFHRLQLLSIILPPLRERNGDIVPLARHLLRQRAGRHRLGALKFSAAAEAGLQGRAWPGNIRELAHEIERALIFASGPTLDLASLGPAPEASPFVPAGTGWRDPAWKLPEGGFSLEQVIDDLVAEALRDTEGNVSAAARRLGVTREFLRYRLASRPEPQDATEIGG